MPARRSPIFEVRKVLILVNNHGMTSPCAVKEFVEQTQWLRSSSDPNPFPRFLIDQMKSAQSLEAWPSTIFWRLLRRRELAQYCVTCSDFDKTVNGQDDQAVIITDASASNLPECSICEGRQLSMFTQKVSVLSENGVDEAKQSFQELIKEYHSMRASFQNNQLEEYVDDLATLSFPGKHSKNMDDRERAEHILDIMNTFRGANQSQLGEVLSDSAVGARLIQSLEDARQTLLANCDKLEKAKTEWEKVTNEWKKEEGFNKDWIQSLAECEKMTVFLFKQKRIEANRNMRFNTRTVRNKTCFCSREKNSENKT